MIRFVYTLSMVYLLAISLCAQQAHDWQLYRIDRSDRALLRQLDRLGASIDKVNPDLNTYVYLRPEMKAELAESGIEIYTIEDKTRRYADSLWQATAGTANPLNGYHTYDEVSTELQTLADTYPAICRLHSIGKTVQGREMWIMKISDNPQTDEPEPEFKYVSTMHGDEITGQELLLNLIHLLLENYDTDPRISNLVDNVEIWIMPNMNYDGTAAGTRWNANGYDLNRNFPDREWDAESDTTGKQPETINMIKFNQQHHFNLSANFHGGALVANYPWDKKLPGDGGSGYYAEAPDDATFIELALAYATPNQPMFNNPAFPNGITNGAEWYEISGGMQDWSYYYFGCKELTIEVSQNKWPPYTQIPQFWLDNQESLLAYLEKALTGIHGAVQDSITMRPVHATITVLQNGSAVESDSIYGAFFNVITPGNYDLRISATGYRSKIVNNVSVTNGPATMVNVVLKPEQRVAFNGTVTDQESGSGLRAANIRFDASDGTELEIITSNNGTFTVSLFPMSYGLNISKAGYFGRIDTLSILTDTSAVFSLQKIYPGKISGNVTDHTGNPVSGAVVFSQGQKDSCNSFGWFEIDSLLPGALSAFAFAEGFRPLRVDSALGNGDSLQIFFHLQPGTAGTLDDFEQPSNYFAGGDWQRGLPEIGPQNAWSGQNVWGTELSGNYSNGPLLSSLESGEFMILGLSKPALRFQHWINCENGMDGGNVKISVDGGQNWQIIYPDNGYTIGALPTPGGNPLAGEAAFSGTLDYWHPETFQLSAYKDYPAAKFRFDFGADSINSAAGWYIDDLQILDANITGLGRSPDHPVSNYQLSNYPNPFNPQTKIKFNLPKRQRVKLHIISLTGQVVNHVYNGVLEAGRQDFVWDGLSDSGMPVASGIYFVTLQSRSSYTVRKIAIIR